MAKINIHQNIWIKKYFFIFLQSNKCPKKYKQIWMYIINCESKALICHPFAYFVVNYYQLFIPSKTEKNKK